MSSINATSLIASVVLISLSALFSGLTLGLMGLDQVGLRIVIESGERPEASASERRDARYARRIQPFRKRGNLLLCTLLFGNVAVNCLLSIIMADMTSGFAGFLISTLSIVIFGEIIPQSVCSRHPLAIGSACIPLVYLFVILTFLASYPVSLILDQLLGEEIGTIYSRNQLKGMLEMYAKMQDTDFQQEDTNIMAGALDFGKKTVGTCMTKIEEVFMLHMDDNLNFETIMKVFQAGHSRVPVFEVDPHGIKKVVALLFVKELILVDPEDALPVRMLCHHWFGRDIPIVFNDCKTSEVMKVFKSGRSHMALVQEVVCVDDGDPYYKTVGIITLEDLIEEILQEEIYDEQDVGVRVRFSRKAKKHELARMAGGSLMHSEHPLLQYLEAKERKELELPPAEITAIASFLRDRYNELFGESLLHRNALEVLIKSSPVRKVAAGESHEPLYVRGQTATVFTLVLDGFIDVCAGEEEFNVEQGPWTVFGQRILSGRSEIVSDFTATVKSSKGLVRLLQLELADYLRILRQDSAKSTPSAAPMEPPQELVTHEVILNGVDSDTTRLIEQVNETCEKMNENPA